MADFLSTKSALAAIEAVIDEAQRRLTIVSPYQIITENFRTRIAAAAVRGVSITILYGKTEMQRRQREELERLPGVRLLYSPSLHAKCYFNERTMVITSLNLLGGSEQNWEMGVRVSSDDKVFQDAVREVDLIIGSAATRNVESPPLFGGVSRGAQDGFCIRCRGRIALDPDRPFCRDCFFIWAQWENWDYDEQWCHQCGATSSATRREPRCTSCEQSMKVS